MGQNDRKDDCEINFITSILRLIAKKVPVLAIWQHKGETMKIGTNDVTEWFENLDVSIKDSLSTKMFSDLVKIGEENEDDLNPENIPVKARATAIYKSMTTPLHPSGIPELPFPLSLMSQKQKTQYISNMIAIEAKKDKVRIVFGSQEWRPSFWPDSVWDWTLLKKALRRYSEGTYSGTGSFSDFLDRTIESILQKKALGVDSHVKDQSRNQEIIKKKERFRGIYRPTNVTKEVIDEENNDECSDTDKDVIEDLTDTVQSVTSSDDISQFKPRRPMRDSPFKNTNSTSSRHIKVPMHVEPVDGEQAGNGYMDVPEQVKNDPQLKDFCIQKIQKNTGGGSCFFKAAVQHINASIGSEFSYLELRKHAHRKFVQYWNFFDRFFSWPMTFTVGSGNNSRQEVIADSEEFKQFLDSERSMESYTETEVELWLMSYIINSPIHVLTYNLPEGHGTDGSRYIWGHFPGQGVVQDPENEKFSCGASCLYLLNEHNQHWQRMVAPLPAIEVGVNPPECVDNLPVGSVIPPVDVNTPRGSLNPPGDLNSPGDVNPPSNLNSSSVSVNSPESAVNPSESDENPQDISANLADVSFPPIGVASLPGKAAQPPGGVSKQSEGVAKLSGEVAMQTRGVAKPPGGVNKPSRVVARPRRGVAKPTGVLKLAGQKSSTRVKAANKNVHSKKRSELKRKSRGPILQDDAEVKVVRGSFNALVAEDVLRDLTEDKLAMPEAVKSDIYYVFSVADPDIDDILAPPDASVMAKDAELDALDKEIRERKDISDADFAERDRRIKEEKFQQVARRKRLQINKERRDLLERDLSSDKMKELFRMNKDYVLKVYSGEIFSERRELFVMGGIHRDRLRSKMIAPFSDEHLDALMDEISLIWMKNEHEVMENSEFIWKVILPETYIKMYMEYFKIDKKEAECWIKETPLHAEDNSDAESEVFDD